MSLPRRRVLGSAAAAVSATVGAARRGPNFGALARGLDGRPVLPGDRDFAGARQLFQPHYEAVAPAAVACPAQAADVAACLDSARRSAVPVVSRGGGHGYAGWSTRAAGPVVDLGAVARVVVAGDGVRVGAGARIGDVNATLAGRGPGVPTGPCPSVGIAGLALGGGLGLASRAYGATCDRLTGATVVTPDGAVREVGPDRAPELYWALRGGGGGTFGVVTEFRFRTRPVADGRPPRWPGTRTGSTGSGGTCTHGRAGARARTTPTRSRPAGARPVTGRTSPGWRRSGAATTPTGCSVSPTPSRSCAWCYVR